MKKLSYLLGLLVILGMAFSSCTEEEAVPPSLAFVAGEGYTTADADAEPGAELMFKLTFTEGDAKLDKLEVMRDGSHVGASPFTDISAGTNFDVITVAPSNAGNYKYDFTLTDKDGESDTKSITITVVAAGNIVSYSGKMLGGQTNATVGSSFASIDGTVYSWSDATANSNKVDFVYFYGTTNQATIAAPNDADAVTAFGELDLNSWATQNATKFKLVTTTLTWADITDDTIILQEASSLSNSKVNLLEVGDIIAFETASTSANAGKKGLIKVTSIDGTSGDDRTISFDVKVQE